MLNQTFLSVQEVLNEFNLSKSTLYKHIKKGHFPESQNVLGKQMFSKMKLDYLLYLIERQLPLDNFKIRYEHHVNALELASSIKHDNLSEYLANDNLIDGDQDDGDDWSEFQQGRTY